MKILEIERADFFVRAIEVMSRCPEVEVDVIRNYSDNLWWPQAAPDWRMRLILAGLSTRISYSMINSYRAIILPLTHMNYEEFSRIPETDLVDALKGLGLVNNRIKYIKTMADLIDHEGDRLREYANNDLIKLIQTKVTGASYKVGQCCALYMKGYHCGIMPVDSGMKDVLAPCLGFSMAKGEYGHEDLRLQFETLVQSVSKGLLQLMDKGSYQTLPVNNPPTWWVHLVLIYYKRHFCNKKKGMLCPLVLNGLISQPNCCSI